MRRECFLCVRVALAAKVAAPAKLGDDAGGVRAKTRDSLMHGEAQVVRRAAKASPCNEIAARKTFESARRTLVASLSAL
jgi:hypothetical protein